MARVVNTYVKDRACPGCGFGPLTWCDNAEAPIPGDCQGVYGDEGRSLGICPECDEQLDPRVVKVTPFGSLPDPDMNDSDMPLPVPPTHYICACGRAWSYATRCICGRDVPNAEEVT